MKTEALIQAARTIRQLRERVAALEGVCRRLLAAGICDVCYEDHCGLMDCECSCHTESVKARSAAKRALKQIVEEKA